MPFIITIQNQISVLAKILATKVQHQQQLEKQQQFVASLNHVVTPVPSRSRKTSSNHDTTSHTSSNRDRLSSVSSSVMPADRISESTGLSQAAGDLNINKNKEKQNEIAMADSVNDGMGCVLS